MKNRHYLKEKFTHGTALLPLSIHHLIFTGEEESYFYLHWHEENELLWIEKGSLSMTIGETTFKLGPGEGSFIISNKLHSAYPIDGDFCHAWVLVFHSDMIAEQTNPRIYNTYLLPLLKEERTLPLKFSTLIPWQKDVYTLTQKIIMLAQCLDLGKELLLKGLFFTLWHHLFIHSLPSTDSSNLPLLTDQSKLSPAIEKITSTYSEDLTLDLLAKSCHLSKGYFSKLFLRTYHRSPIAYLIRHRLLKSCDLLLESDKKIADIARLVGFNNISHYNREFIKTIGCTPSAYRK